jgi:hypothetical protein
MDQGMSSREACRVVGINRRTGKRWRNGTNPTKNRPGRPAHRVSAVRAVPLSRSRHLTVDERIYIADRVREKAPVRRIAAELERSPSTISREIRRNRHPTNGQYRPHAAQARAESRLPRPKPGKIARSPELREFVQNKLDRRWSPEQICQALPKHFPDQPELHVVHVVHETIYQALYVQGRGELRRDLAKALQTGPTPAGLHARFASRFTRSEPRGRALEYMAGLVAARPRRQLPAYRSNRRSVWRERGVRSRAVRPVRCKFRGRSDCWVWWCSERWSIRVIRSRGYGLGWLVWL